MKFIKRLALLLLILITVLYFFTFNNDSQQQESFPLSQLDTDRGVQVDGDVKSQPSPSPAEKVNNQLLAEEWLFDDSGLVAQQAEFPDLAKVDHPHDLSVQISKYMNLEGQEISRVVGGADEAGNYRVTRVVRSAFKYPMIRHEEWWHQMDGGQKLQRRVSMVADHVMVGLLDGKDPEDLRKIVAQSGAELQKTKYNSQIYLVKCDGQKTDAMRMLLTKLNGNKILTQIAEPNYIVYAIGTPDDPSLNQMYALNNTG
ncbi:MAG: hypothetical protein HRU15_10540, partial [Planctomycetes bacterium]|nr:hypothetical protein [Planctomycetota bacterium]